MGAAPPPNSYRSSVTCREIAPGDRDAVIALLGKGFATWRSEAFWSQAFDRLARRALPEGLPRFGFALVADGDVVGVLLLLAAPMGGETPTTRCNVSSWYVEPAYRPFATLLVRRALSLPEAVYMNVSPAPQTWALQRAQGFEPYVAGRAIGFPALSWRGGRRPVRHGPDWFEPGPDLPAHEASLLREHQGWGCLSLICATPSGRVPFVFGRRRRGGIPFAYLIYCRSLESLSACAGPIGRFLARRGIVAIVADADARLEGMPSRYRPGFPKFYRGATAPRPGDLAYTERAIFGV